MKPAVSYTRLFWWTLGAIVLIRVLYVLTFPFDLSGDEAYYWDWGRQLSWGYFSKPPMIAWLMALAGWFSQDTDSGIRLMAVALGTGSLLFIWALMRKMWDERAAFWAILLTLASPGNVAVNLILTIDAPLMFFWSGALFSFYMQVHENRHRITWTVVTTLMLGFGLLSKQMTFAFYPLALVYLISQSDLRSNLKRLSLWLSWAVSLAFLVPTILWNAQNDWITIKHTQHHFEGKAITFMDILSRVGEFFGSQLGVLSPVTGVAIAILVVGLLIHFRKWSPKVAYLAIFSVPGLLFVSLMLLRQSINPNWPAVFYVGAVMLLGAAVSGAEGLPKNWSKKWPGWRYPSVICGAIFAVLIMVLPHILDWTKQTGAKWDPVVRLEGWYELGKKVQKVREMHSHDLEEPFILATGHRYTTSHLAFYLVDQPKVYHWPENPGTIESQYELWGFPEELAEKDAFIVVAGQNEELPESLYPMFESIEPLEEIQITRSAKRIRYYSLYIGKSFKLTSSTPASHP